MFFDCTTKPLDCTYLRKGHFDIVSALLRTEGVEADVDIRCTTDGATALFAAAESGRLDIVKLLLYVKDSCC